MSQPMPVISAPGAMRDTYCAHYDECLDVAVRRGWPGFSCVECPVYGTARDTSLARDFALRSHDPTPLITGAGGGRGFGGGGAKHASALTPSIGFDPARPIDPTYDDPATLPPAKEKPMDAVDPGHIERTGPGSVKLNFSRELEAFKDIKAATDEIPLELASAIVETGARVDVQGEADSSHIIERTPVERARAIRNEIEDLDRRRGMAVRELGELLEGLEADVASMRALVGGGAPARSTPARMAWAQMPASGADEHLEKLVARTVKKAPKHPEPPVGKGSIKPGSLTDRILKQANGKTFTSSAMGTALGEGRQKVAVALWAMAQAGHIERVGQKGSGRYRPTRGVAAA